LNLSGTENNLYLMKELGMRLKDIRIAMSLTQKQAAERAGISSKTLERIENGENVRVEGILNLLRAMDLLDNLDILIPEQNITPTMQHDYGKKRMRATPIKSKEKVNSEWKWGDES